mgnify:CR=1 FL=1|tara:strand:- start:327 stop:497 length:171 start_codon:yes stop_codon:yes gene_type:complete
MVDEWIFIVFAIIIIAGGLSRAAGDDPRENNSFTFWLIAILVLMGLFGAYTFLKYL